MTRDIIISTSIESADFTRLGDQIAEAEKGGADWVHIDSMDGRFVPNLTMGPLIVAACRQATALPLDVHLMVREPENLVEAFANAGATGLTIHPEASPNLHRTLQTIREMGCKPGVAINPGTPGLAVRPVLHMVDLVLVMTVNPGFSGQVFLPETLAKIEKIRGWMDEINPDAILQVDGGMNAETLPLAYKAGARAFVAATAVFKYPDGIAAGIKALREAGG
ncbi:MAG: ribulose-phosphate 3-epimerase [Anaerolineales bacterium]|jgi:ribulose-phosphate 3-epimerase